jgi:Tfp pilus assembly major pilin PilA
MERFGKRQDGLTFISLLVVLAVIGFFAYIGIKLTPVYLENFSVKSSLKSLAEEESQGLGVGELRSRLLKRLEINSVTHVSDRDIEVRTAANSTTVSVQYDVVQPFYGNVSILISFDDSVVLSAR